MICDPRRGTSRPAEWFLSILSALKRLLCQDIESRLAGLAVEVFEQGVMEDGVVGGSSQKQGHAGPEFQVVGVGKDRFSDASFHIQNKLGAFSESWA